MLLYFSYLFRLYAVVVHYAFDLIGQSKGPKIWGGDDIGMRILGWQGCVIYTGSPRIVLFFGEKKTPYYVKSALFGDYFSTITSEMGENVFQSPLF